MANENKKEMTLEGLAITIDGLAKVVEAGFKKTEENAKAIAKTAQKDNESLAVMVANEFGQVRKEMANEFGQVRKEMANGFNDVQTQIRGLDGKIIKLQTETVWVKDVLEKHTTILKRLDEERIFTLNYVKRLENEIEKIKVHLKIA